MKRLNPAEHAAHSWRITEVADDFELVDAWELPIRGSRSQFADLVALFEGMDPATDRGSWMTRALFAIRMSLGRIFGWDKRTNELPIPGCTESSVRARLTADLRSSRGTANSTTPFRFVFQTDTEWVAELSNGTVHALVQLGWVEDGADPFRGRLGVYVIPRGRLGRLYMAAIAPFRHLIVYPALGRRLQRAWTAKATTAA